MNEGHPLYADETLEFDDDTSSEVDFTEHYDDYYKSLFAALDNSTEFTNLWEYYFNGSSYTTTSSTSSTDDLEKQDNGYRSPRKRNRSDSPPPAPPRKKTRSETIVLDDN